MLSYKIARKHANSGKKPSQIAVEHGIYVMYLPFKKIKGIAISVDSEKFIIINSLLKEIEQEFVCGHELGHFTLHADINFLFILKHTYTYSKHEYQANRFACELMIGEKAEDYFSCISEAATRGRLEEMVSLIQELDRDE